MAKGFPSITSAIPQDVRSFLDRVREALSASGGDKLVSVNDLQSGVYANANSNATKISFATPPAPTGLSASGALANIIVSWDAPSFDGYAYAQIFAAQTDNLSLAVMVGMSPGAVFVHNVGQAATYYYWVRFVNQDFAIGPFNSTNGTLGATGADPAYLISVLQNVSSNEPLNLPGNAIKIIDPAGTQAAITPFTIVTSATTVNGVSVPAGVYMNAAYILNGSITNAQIANATIDSAKIASVNAGTINAGYLSADRINSNTISADKLNVSALSAISANLGTVTAGTIQTAPSSSYYVQIQAGATYPLWYGQGDVNTSNGLFYVDNAGNAVFKGQITGGSININSRFKVANDGTVSITDSSGNPILVSGSGVNWNAVYNFPLITNANISTFIASSAISDAYIADLTIGTVKIANNAISYVTKASSSTLTINVHGSSGNNTSLIIIAKAQQNGDSGSLTLQTQTHNTTTGVTGSVVSQDSASYGGGGNGIGVTSVVMTTMTIGFSGTVAISLSAVANNGSTSGYVINTLEVLK